MLPDWLTPMTTLDWQALLTVETAVEYIAFLVMGLVTGIVGVIMGVGGGIFIVPALRIFPGFFPDIFPPLDAVMVSGTTLMLVAVNAVSGGIAYRRMRVVDRRSAYLFAAAAIPGSVVGVFGLKKALEGVPGIFDTLFGMLLLILAVRILIQQFERQQRASIAAARRQRLVSGHRLSRRVITTEAGVTYSYRLWEIAAVGVNFVLGFVSSFFGVGGGFLRVPLLVYLFKFPVPVAVSTSIFAIAFYAPAGAITHIYYGHVQWFPTFVLIGAGLVVGSQIGARLSLRVRSMWIMRSLMVLVTIMGVQLIVQGLTG